MNIRYPIYEGVYRILTLKGSNMDVLAGEIERIIYLKSDKT